MFIMLVITVMSPGNSTMPPKKDSPSCHLLSPFLSSQAFPSRQPFPCCLCTHSLTPVWWTNLACTSNKYISTVCYDSAGYTSVAAAAAATGTVFFIQQYQRLKAHYQVGEKMAGTGSFFGGIFLLAA